VASTTPVSFAELRSMNAVAAIRKIVAAPIDETKILRFITSSPKPWVRIAFSVLAE
jgi:hypothetical protein